VFFLLFGYIGPGYGISMAFNLIGVGQPYFGYRLRHGFIWIWARGFQFVLAFVFVGISWARAKAENMPFIPLGVWEVGAPCDRFVTKSTRPRTSTHVHCATTYSSMILCQVTHIDRDHTYGHGARAMRSSFTISFGSRF
jgi:hypothetical protein